MKIAKYDKKSNEGNELYKPLKYISFVCGIIIAQKILPSDRALWLHAFLLLIFGAIFGLLVFGGALLFSSLRNVFPDRSKWYKLFSYLIIFALTFFALNSYRIF